MQKGTITADVFEGLGSIVKGTGIGLKKAMAGGGSDAVSPVENLTSENQAAASDQTASSVDPNLSAKLTAKQTGQIREEFQILKELERIRNLQAQQKSAQKQAEESGPQKQKKQVIEAQKAKEKKEALSVTQAKRGVETRLSAG